MFDFTNSIKAGIAAAEVAKENVREISEVFAELAKQVEKFSGGSLTVKLEKTPDVWGARHGLLGIGSIGAAVASASLGLDKAMGNSVKYVTNLMLVNTQPPNQKAPLATVDTSKLGYPVKFTYADQVSNASDKVSLEMILAGILEHPDSGKILTRMMQPVETEGESDES
ncbi:hypothetical protein [Pseudomonas monsensis]|uniref:hypothetical protein n=1 Tax=Pseudomonas monsensis TaxID=2745509 RepID=UPI002ABA8DD2|nr:hypothetical protein [Pseudomonas monsensis]MDZ3826341.1 hypothetical protein [Pseudomonas monsensis]